ncbi:23S rRNA (adenine(2503)-C(2))-methyltransferase RlmN [bacterium]|nr:MAG: 23S rRNA (adenine(2503)-C(2))-methyltransferase RlmN [bacterium]
MTSHDGKVNIKDLTRADLTEQLIQMGEKRHRASQIYQWLFKKWIETFDDMSNISKSLREKLDRHYYISKLEPIDSVQSSSDGSRKFLLACEDGSIIETVLMETAGHKTICISSQVGCPVGCKFCRTGAGGFVRNLSSDEILNQVIYFKKHHLEPHKRFNIVFMGMGEPMLNMVSVIKAIEILNDESALALGEKRITLSTVGFVEKIKRLIDSNAKFKLAISLNATDDATRRKIIPNASNIRELLDAAEQFAIARDTRVTLEYVMLEDINDTAEDASRLAEMTTGRPFKINLIPFNEWEGCEFKTPSEERIDEFIRVLLPVAPAVTVRRSRGSDISAACGQLRASRLTTNE